jgi:hypothetical protein
VRSPQSMMPGRTSYRALAKMWIAIRPAPLVWQSVSALVRAAWQPSVGCANPRRLKCLSGTLRAQGQKLSRWDASGTPPSGLAARPVPTGIAVEILQKGGSESESSDGLGDSLTFQRPVALQVPAPRRRQDSPVRAGARHAPLPGESQSGNIRAFGASLRCFGVADAKARDAFDVSVEFTVASVASPGDSPWYDACSSSPQPARPADEGSL